MTGSTLLHLARRTGALLAICLPLGLAAAVATPLATAPAAKVTKTVKAAPVAATTPEARAMRERIEKAPQGVAGLHRGSKGMQCEKCHGNTVAPDDNQTVENRECVTCHEGYPPMAELSAKKLTNKAINAHGSHLGPEINCTTCHQGHQESKAYCLNCHTNFSMPMPGNRPAAR